MDCAYHGPRPGETYLETEADLDEEEFMTEWEAQFLASVGAQEHDLSSAQEAKLAEIETLIQERRALARRGQWWR